MGLPGAAAAVGTAPGFLGMKSGSRYVRMDDVLHQDHAGAGDGGVGVRGGGGGGARRYVLACSVFASLNHVLLGYGELSSAELIQWRFLNLGGGFGNRS